jgi:hypothetical protein
MANDEKNKEVVMSPEKLALYNMALAEAMFELLAEKGILTGPEILERVKKLKSDAQIQDAQIQFRWLQ